MKQFVNNGITCFNDSQFAMEQESCKSYLISPIVVKVEKFMIDYYGTLKKLRNNLSHASHQRFPILANSLAIRQVLLRNNGKKNGYIRFSYVLKTGHFGTLMLLNHIYVLVI